MKKKKKFFITITVIFIIILILHVPRSFSYLTKNTIDLTWKIQYTDHFLELTTAEKQELFKILEPMYCIKKWIIIPSGGWDYAIRIYDSDGKSVSSFVNHNDYITIQGKQYYTFNFDVNLYNEFIERILYKHKIYHYNPSDL